MDDNYILLDDEEVQEDQKEEVETVEAEQISMDDFPVPAPVRKLRKNETWSHNSPMIISDYDPKDVKKVMRVNNILSQWGRTAHPKTDDEVEQRIYEYMEYCEKIGVRPTVEGMGLAIGYTRISMHNWRHGLKCTPRRTEIINHAYDVMASFDADMVINNNMPQIPYIFRSKNYYGMRDQTDVVITPNVMEAQRTPDEIAEQYAFLDDVEEDATGAE